MPDAITFDSATPRLALPLLFAAQAQKEIFHNEALARIDALMHPVVQGEEAEPPNAPENGACWLVAPAAQGAWAGRAGMLAMWQFGQWLFAAPFPGMRIFDASMQQFAIFSNSWRKADPVEEPSGGVNVDSQARAAIEALISALRAAGIFPSA